MLFFLLRTRNSGVLLLGDVPVELENGRYVVEKAGYESSRGELLGQDSTRLSSRCIDVFEQAVQEESEVGGDANARVSAIVGGHTADHFVHVDHHAMCAKFACNETSSNSKFIKRLKRRKKIFNQNYVYLFVCFLRIAFIEAVVVYTVSYLFSSLTMSVYVCILFDFLHINYFKDNFIT